MPMIQLVPQSEYISRQGTRTRAHLAREYHSLVKANADQLRARGLRGIVERHGYNAAESLSWLSEGALDPHLEAFVVVGENGNMVGSATIQTDVCLRRLRAPFLPTGIQRKLAPLHVDFPFAQPNVHGWLSQEYRAACEEGSAEATVYGALLRRVKERRILRTDDPKHLPTQALAWTLEPASPMLRELAKTEFGLTDMGLYDDGERRGELPARTCLYVEKVPTNTPLHEQYAATCHMLRDGLQA